MSEISMPFTLPLDEDGFLRRECPHCEREFKWRPESGGTDDDSGVPMPAEGYACPYCAQRAPLDHWWTKTQLEYAEQLAASEILGPELKKFEQRPDPRSMLSFSVEIDVPKKPAPLTEANDMRRIEFACHASEPVKVLEDWSGDVHCLICGGCAQSE